MVGSGTQEGVFTLKRQQQLRASDGMKSGSRLHPVVHVEVIWDRQRVLRKVP